MRGLGLTFEPLDDISIPQATPPTDYAVTLEQIAPNINTLVQEERAPGESWIDSLARLVPSILASDAQRRLLNVNIDRARQGLPPLDTSQYGVGVNVGLTGDTQKLVMWGAVGFAALALLGIIKLGRR